MSFIRQLLKKMAEKGEPESWGIADDPSGIGRMLVASYHLDDDALAMLHVIDEDGDLPLGAGQ